MFSLREISRASKLVVFIVNTYMVALNNRFPAGDVRQFPQTIGEAMAKNGGNLDLCFIVLPNNNADNYAAVKKRCSVDFGSK